jgi:hypothetical protein
MRYRFPNFGSFIMDNPLPEFTKLLNSNTKTQELPV